MRFKLFMVLLFSLSTMTTLVYIQFASWKRIEDVDLLKNAIQKQIGLILESYYASGNDDNVNQLVENLKRLEQNLDLHLDLSSQDDYCVDNSQVCDEIYHGNLADLPWHVKAWTLDANCSKPIGHLLTIISIQNGSEFEEETFKSIKRQYPDVAILKASTIFAAAKLIGYVLEFFCLFGTIWVIFKHCAENENESKTWKKLADKVTTPFVFVALNLKAFPDNWGNFERALRLLINSKNIAVVSPATKNVQSGHWKSHCWQAEMTQYKLILTPGYFQSQCDCMKCTLLWEDYGPFVTKTKHLTNFLDTNVGSPYLMFTDFFLRLKLSDQNILSCPDLMVETMIANHSTAAANLDWLSLAQKWQFQEVSIDHGPADEKIAEFTCQDIHKVCEPEKQTQSFLAPLCCSRGANHIVRVLDTISTQLDIHYELDSGSLLGAVKLNNFIPWDIDGDVYIDTQDMKHFHHNGSARFMLNTEGIEIFNWEKNNYWDQGAGHYQLAYAGLQFELMGKRGLKKRNQGQPTKVLFGTTWAKAHQHPGQYLRGRYGSGYLRHLQSWRYLSDMSNAFDTYSKSKDWTLCQDKSSHACLELYPTDGNWLWLPNRFP